MQVTKEYLADNFLTAYFIDNERQNIEIQATSEDKRKSIQPSYHLMKIEMNTKH
jgi:hypothetical protein